METLKIEIPKGYEVDSFDPDTGEIKFKEKPKNLLERLTTIEAILEEHDTTLDEVKEQFKNVPEHLMWQHIAELLIESLNEGKEPDWDDPNQRKYESRWIMSPSGFRFHGCANWLTHSYVGPRLCLLDSSRWSHVAKYFTQLFRKFMVIDDE